MIRGWCGVGDDSARERGHGSDAGVIGRLKLGSTWAFGERMVGGARAYPLHACLKFFLRSCDQQGAEFLSPSNRILDIYLLSE